MDYYHSPTMHHNSMLLSKYFVHFVYIMLKYLRMHIRAQEFLFCSPVLRGETKSEIFERFEISYFHKFAFLPGSNYTLSLTSEEYGSGWAAIPGPLCHN